MLIHGFFVNMLDTIFGTTSILSDYLQGEKVDLCSVKKTVLSVSKTTIIQKGTTVREILG